MTKIGVRQLRVLIKELNPSAKVFHSSKETLLKVYETLKYDKNARINHIYTQQHKIETYHDEDTPLMELTVSQLRQEIDNAYIEPRLPIYAKNKTKLRDDLRNIKLVLKYRCKLPRWIHPPYKPNERNFPNMILRPYFQELKLVREYLDNSEEIKLYFKLAVLYEIRNK
tara:strand:- start:2848 stop:3354 length:507 start_codon:yes stop_codon:yes gene_type:complete